MENEDYEIGSYEATDGSCASSVESSSSPDNPDAKMEDGTALADGAVSPDDKRDSACPEDAQGHAKEGSKKKRASKTAKLKQSKQDIRREQFLARVVAKAPQKNGVELECENEEEKSSLTLVAPSMTNGASKMVIGQQGAMDHASTKNECDAMGSEGGVKGVSTKGEARLDDVEGSKGGGRKSKANGYVNGCQAGKGKAGSGGQTRGCCEDSAGGDPGFPGPTQGVPSKGASGHIEESDSAELEEDWEAAVETFSRKISVNKQGVRGGLNGLHGVSHEDGAAVTGASPDVSTGGINQPAWQGVNGSVLMAGAAVVKVMYPGHDGLEVSRKDHQDGTHKRGSEGAPNGPSLSVLGGGLRPEYTYTATGLGRSRSTNDRAWRPDDTSRPPTLPPAISARLNGAPGGLAAQESALMRMGVNGGVGGVGVGVSGAWQQLTAHFPKSQWPSPHSQDPSTVGGTSGSGTGGSPICPICAEELDMTDSSFVPCTCGFRLCLFCHHRIATDDGRCPGCRRAYSPDVTQAKAPAGPSRSLRL